MLPVSVYSFLSLFHPSPDEILCVIQIITYACFITTEKYEAYAFRSETVHEDHDNKPTGMENGFLWDSDSDESLDKDVENISEVGLNTDWCCFLYSISVKNVGCAWIKGIGADHQIASGTFATVWSSLLLLMKVISGGLSIVSAKGGKTGRATILYGLGCPETLSFFQSFGVFLINH